MTASLMQLKRWQLQSATGDVFDTILQNSFDLVDGVRGVAVEMKNHSVSSGAAVWWNKNHHTYQMGFGRESLVWQHTDGVRGQAFHGFFNCTLCDDDVECFRCRY